MLASINLDLKKKQPKNLGKSQKKTRVIGDICESDLHCKMSTPDYPAICLRNPTLVEAVTNITEASLLHHSDEHPPDYL